MSPDTGLPVTTPSDREIVVTRVFDAEGWSMPVSEIDLRPGGAHRSVWLHSDGGEMEIRGVYRLDGYLAELR